MRNLGMGILFKRGYMLFIADLFKNKEFIVCTWNL